jgi:ADP-heptose:LPS heptosyltransferase
MTWYTIKFLIVYLVKKILRLNKKTNLKNLLFKKIIKIYIVMFGGIGDFFLMTPMLKHIKEKLKNSYISLLTNNKAIVEYLTTQSSVVDEVHLLNITEYSVNKFLKYCFSLRRQNIDIFIIPYINLNQNTLLIGLLGGAKILIGHGNGGTYRNIWSKILDIAIPLKEKVYEPLQYLSIAEYLTNSVPEKVKLVVEIPKHVENKIYSQLKLLGIDLSNSMLVQLSASNGKVTWKNWPTLYFAKLLDAIIERYKINVIVIGSPEEVKIAEEVKKQMKHKFINLVGKTTLPELVACIKMAKIILCLDSSVLHIASALGKPCIALFGPTDIWAYGGNSYVITNPVKCQPCVSFVNRNPLANIVDYCPDRKCLNEISVEKVLDKFDEIWNHK